jgi:hypothetical protein
MAKKAPEVPTPVAIRDVAYRANNCVPLDGTEPMTAPMPLMSVLTADIPDATLWEGCIIYVSDGGAGTRFRGSNGTAWVNLG